MNIIQENLNVILFKFKGFDCTASKFDKDTLYKIYRWNHNNPDYVQTEYLLYNGKWSYYLSDIPGLFTSDQIKEMFSKDEKDNS